MPCFLHSSCSDARLASACSRPSARTKLAVEAITKSAEAMISGIFDGGKRRSSMPPAATLATWNGSSGPILSAREPLYEHAALTARASAASQTGTTTSPRREQERQRRSSDCP